jgi:hypothetical protein
MATLANLASGNIYLNDFKSMITYKGVGALVTPSCRRMAGSFVVDRPKA